MNKNALLIACNISMFLTCFSQKNGDTLNACWWIKNPTNFQFLQRNAKSILVKSKDDCVLALLDKLVDSVSSVNGTKYLKTISSFRSVSDGYVSEYFDEIGAELFYRHFNNLIMIIYKKNSQFDSPLEKMIINSLGIRIGDSKNPVVERQKLTTFIESNGSALKLTIDQKQYLKYLQQKIDEFLADQ